MSEMTTEARPRRKSLAEQLDRLDSILDALADGLTQAVADAAREGIRPVVKEVLIAVLTDPDLRRLIIPLPPVLANRSHTYVPRALRVLGWWTQVMTAVIARWTVIRCGIVFAIGVVMRRYRAARFLIAAGEDRVGKPFPTRRVVAVATVAGLTGAIACVLVPCALAGVIGGIGVGCVATAVQLALWATEPPRVAPPSGSEESA